MLGYFQLPWETSPPIAPTWDKSQSYRFRVQTTDRVGNVGAWVESGQVMVSQVTKYYYFQG